jgi:hypothetical protein
MMVIRVVLGLPAVESKAASWVLELVDAHGRQCTQQICLEVSHPLRPPSCGVRQRLGSGFGGSDKQNPEGLGR